ncbi:hypothetical protein [Anaeromicropila herbilytica]|uniref:Uncharacterized protein n=1 Tax=Anaeromicropila herbilytica TaxID=2785025 RepID=A0A7R7EMD7_9FIRM|nr:hypothetical protein [Anaeromicropila herbilytica]BCN31172.1 hypothetical protein bsdtb5_24670 [Anaeromicropila herbilytica]
MLIDIRHIAIEKSLNIILRSSKRSPERCARNLLELGTGVYKKNSNVMKEGLYPLFVDLCKKNDKEAIKELFYRTFLD